MKTQGVRQSPDIFGYSCTADSRVQRAHEHEHGERESETPRRRRDLDNWQSKTPGAIKKVGGRTEGRTSGARDPRNLCGFLLHPLSPLLFATSCFLPAFQVPTPFRSPSFQTSFSLSETNTVFLLARLSCCKSSNATATSLRPFYSARYSGPLLLRSISLLLPHSSLTNHTSCRRP